MVKFYRSPFEECFTDDSISLFCSSPFPSVHFSSRIRNLPVCLRPNTVLGIHRTQATGAGAVKSNLLAFDYETRGRVIRYIRGLLLEVEKLFALAADKVRMMAPMDEFETRRLSWVVEADQFSLLHHIVDKSVNRPYSQAGGRSTSIFVNFACAERSYCFVQSGQDRLTLFCFPDICHFWRVIARGSEPLWRMDGRVGVFLYLRALIAQGLIAPGSIPRSLLRTFNFEIWKLKCLGACPEDLYYTREFGVSIF